MQSNALLVMRPANCSHILTAALVGPAGQETNARRSKSQVESGGNTHLLQQQQQSKAGRIPPVRPCLLWHAVHLLWHSSPTHVHPGWRRMSGLGSTRKGS